MECARPVRWGPAPRPRSLAPKRVVRLVPSKQRRAAWTESRREADAALAQERREAQQLREQQRKSKAKAAVRSGRVRAEVVVDADMQHVELESGDDVDSESEAAPVPPAAPMELEAFDAEALRDLFGFRLPAAVGVDESELAAAARAKLGSCATLSTELDDLQANGEVTVVLKETGPERGRRVYFAPLRGASAGSEMRALWHAAKVPQTEAELTRALVERGLRSSEEIRARRERRAASNAAIREADNERRAAERKKPLRVGRMRNAPRGSLAALEAEN